MIGMMSKSEIALVRVAIIASKRTWLSFLPWEQSTSTARYNLTFLTYHKVFNDFVPSYNPLFRSVMLRITQKDALTIQSMRVSSIGIRESAAQPKP